MRSFLLGLLVAVAAEREHCDDVSALQVTSRRHSSSVRAPEYAPDFMNLMEVAQSQIEGLRQHPPASWKDSEETILKDIKTMIETQLQAYLQNEHSSDQSDFGTRKIQHIDCNVDANRRFTSGGDVAYADAQVAKWEAKHKACRRSEKGWQDYKSIAEDGTLCEDAEWATHEILNKHLKLASAINESRSLAQSYEVLMPVGKQTCALDQLQYETHYCAWRTARFNACAGSRACHNQVDLNGLQNGLLARSENRRRLWQTLETMICRVEHLLTSFPNSTHPGDFVAGDFDTPDPCTDIAVNHTLFNLAMDIPPVHDCQGGDVVPLAPSTSNCEPWKLQKYDTWSPPQHFLVPSTCQGNCPDLSHTSFVKPAGCEHEPEECAFYTHHKTACGHFDNDDFNATTACCACSELTSSGGVACPSTLQAVVYSNDMDFTDYPAVEEQFDIRSWQAGVALAGECNVIEFPKFMTGGLFVNVDLDTTVHLNATRGRLDMYLADRSSVYVVIDGTSGPLATWMGGPMGGFQYTAQALTTSCGTLNVFHRTFNERQNIVRLPPTYDPLAIVVVPECE